MKTKELARIAIIAGIYEVMFTSFSNILYLEMITFTLCLFSMIFSKKIAIYSAFCFGMVNMLVMGITPWTMMYVIIYPVYAWIMNTGKTIFMKHDLIFAAVVGILSFLGGQLLEIPYLLVSKSITALYLLMGVKTSLIQGGISFIAALFLTAPIKPIVIEMEKK